jgi:hypothetical protein
MFFPPVFAPPATCPGSRRLENWNRATPIADDDKILRKNVKFRKKMGERTGEDYV